MMNNSITVQQAAQMLLSSDNILLVCHKNPDGDTIGSAGGLCYALKKIGKKCAIICNDSIPEKYDFLKLELFKKEFVPEFVVAVDIASKTLFGDVLTKQIDIVDLCIDHHPSNTSYAKTTCCYDKLPATAQLVFEIIEVMGVDIDKDIANCIYTGIATDTGCFKYPATNANTHIIASKLIQAGAEHSFISNRFFITKSRKSILLEKYALNNLELFFDYRCALVVITQQVLKDIDATQTDIEGISSIPRSIEGVEVGVTIRQLSESQFKVSFRTTENANASEIASGFGGGGHTRAAGCEVVGDIDSVKKAVLREVEKALCN